MKKRVPLQGSELEEYFARKKLEEEAKKRKEFEKNKKSKIESDSEVFRKWKFEKLNLNKGRKRWWIVEKGGISKRYGLYNW